MNLMKKLLTLWGCILLAAPSLSARILTGKQALANFQASVSAYKASQTAQNAEKVLEDYARLGSQTGKTVGDNIISQAGLSMNDIQTRAKPIHNAPIKAATKAEVKKELDDLKKTNPEMTPAIQDVQKQVDTAKTAADLDESLEGLAALEFLNEQDQQIDAEVSKIKATGNKKQIEAATNIQKMWKGYKARKDLKEMEKQADAALAKLKTLPIGAMPSPTPPPAPIAPLIFSQFTKMVRDANIQDAGIKGKAEAALQKLEFATGDRSALENEIKGYIKEYKDKVSACSAEAQQLTINLNSHAQEAQKLIKEADQGLSGWVQGADQDKLQKTNLAIGDHKNYHMTLFKKLTDFTKKGCTSNILDSKINADLEDAIQKATEADSALEEKYAKMLQQLKVPTAAPAKFDASVVTKLENLIFNAKLSGDNLNNAQNAVGGYKNGTLSANAAETRIKSLVSLTQPPANMPPAPSIKGLEEQQAAEHIQAKVKELRKMVADSGIKDQNILFEMGSSIQSYQDHPTDEQFEIVRKNIQKYIDTAKAQAQIVPGSLVPVVPSKYSPVSLPPAADIPPAPSITGYEQQEADKDYNYLNGLITKASLSGDDLAAANKALNGYKYKTLSYEFAKQQIDALVKRHKSKMLEPAPAPEKESQLQPESLSKGPGVPKSDTSLPSSVKPSPAPVPVAKSYNYSNITAAMAAADIAVLNKSRKNATPEQKEQAKELYNAAIEKGLDADFETKPRLNALNAAYNLGNPRLE